VVSARYRLAHIARAVRLDDRRRSVVHADHHGRGCAGVCDLLHYERRGAVRLSHPADFARADQTQKPCAAKLVNCGPWESSRPVYIE
jgi:hypothetical protein